MKKQLWLTDDELILIQVSLEYWCDRLKDSSNIAAANLPHRAAGKYVIERINNILVKVKKALVGR